MHFTDKVVYTTENVASLAVDDEWWKIYESSFPANERESKDIILRTVGHELGLAVCAKLNNKTIGLAAFHFLVEPCVVFITYVAVSPKFRHHAIGTKLINNSIELANRFLKQKGFHPIGFVLEVEDPALAPTPKQRTERSQRIRFYNKIGAQVLNCPYFLPSLNENTYPTPMLLMFKSQELNHPPSFMLSKSIVNAIYFEKYAAINGVPTEALAKLMDIMHN